MPASPDADKPKKTNLQAAFIAYVKSIYDGDDPARIAAVLEDIRRAVYPIDETKQPKYRRPTEVEGREYLTALLEGRDILKGVIISKDIAEQCAIRKSPQTRVKLAQFLLAEQRKPTAQVTQIQTAGDAVPSVPKPRRKPSGNGGPDQ